VTVACWYDRRDGRVWSMNASAGRLEHLRDNPGVTITVFDDWWYSHVSLIGRVVEIREDPRRSTAARCRSVTRAGRTSATESFARDGHRRRRTLGAWRVEH
jgi:hypothetical protein